MNIPVKQLVYLPVKEGVLSVSHWDKDNHIQDVEGCFGYFFTPKQLNEYTKCVIQQALETAADKVEMTGIAYGNDTSITDYEVDKQSITNTFEEIYNHFKASE